MLQSHLDNVQESGWLLVHKNIRHLHCPVHLASG
jgi:hypothetical protein